MIDRDPVDTNYESQKTGDIDKKKVTENVEEVVVSTTQVASN